MSELIALVDMDGTLCDYTGALDRDLATLRAPSEIINANDDAPHLEARRRLIKSQPGWWLRLSPLTLGINIVEFLQEEGYTIHILTKGPVRLTNAWTEKVEWCRNFVPNAQVTITEDKGLVYGKILVDDWPPYIKRWLEWRPRGKVIMPAQPWNDKYSHQNVLRYDGKNEDDLRQFIDRGHNDSIG